MDMATTVVGLVTPHLLRVVDLANEAQKGANVEWHLRGIVSTTLAELRDQWNGPALEAAYIEGLENAAASAMPSREVFIRVLKAAAAAARGSGRG